MKEIKESEENLNLKIKELDQQLVGILEERLELIRRMKEKGIGDERKYLEKLNTKSVTFLLDEIFKEFEKKARKMNLKSIVAVGPVIIEDGKLMVNKDGKDDFYKIPGGTIESGTEDLEEACYREAKEENNANIEILKPLNPMIIWKNPQTEESMAILLIHYLAKLKNKEEVKPIPPIKEIRWLDIKEIIFGKYLIAPNIKFLIEKGDIK
jgi:ADP-ribose pyrophosphatase YjhB (NUDIX family)